MRSVWIGLGWAASVAAAFFLGQQVAGDAPPSSGPVTIHRTEAPPEEAEVRLVGAPGGATAEAGNADGRVRPTAPTVEPEEAFTLQGVATLDEASARFMEHVRWLLSQGRTGHLEILRILNDEVVENGDAKRLFQDERDGVVLIYPWARFLLDHERQVVDFMETLFQTMAEKPDHFAEYDNDTLEMFVDGLAVPLPGVVDAERLVVFRDYVIQILQQPEDEQPQAIRSERRHLSQLLKMWAPRLGPEEALARLTQGDLPWQEALPLLTQVPPDALGQVDLAGILGPPLVQGEQDALRALGRITPSAHQLDALDETVLQALEQGTWNGWQLRSYVGSTGRGTWPGPQGLFERALGSGERSREAVGYAVMVTRPPPPRDWLDWLLGAYTFDDGTRTRIEKLRDGER